MSDTITCTKCSSPYGYFDGTNNVCPECAHEWNPNAVQEDSNAVRDAHGNILQDGDDVIIIKDLKVGGSSNALKQGTKVRNIKLVDKDHNIDCRIDGFGAMSLKSEFVKKA